MIYIFLKNLFMFSVVHTMFDHHINNEGSRLEYVILIFFMLGAMAVAERIQIRMIDPRH